MASQIKKNRNHTMNSMDPTRGSNRIRSVHPMQEWEEEHEYDEYDSDSWHFKEYGEEHRYARPTRPSTAKAAYQKSLALIHQKVTHAPFYMEDIGEKQSDHVPSPDAHHHPVSNHAVQERNYILPTRFYPQGSGERIDRVQAVGRTQLQRVLPSYELSTSETRESGLGPRLETMSYPRLSGNRKNRDQFED